jgi:aspartate aminotransferase-like enzyme
VLNDLPMLRGAHVARGLRLALDCVSSLGCVQLELAGVDLASAASGKGLGSFAGLAVVFHNQPVPAAPGRLPRYLDLGLYAAGDGVAFTHSSNLVRALAAAVARRDWPAWLDQVAADGAWLRRALRARGLPILAPEHAAAPAVTTIVPPREIGAQRLGEELERAGFLLSFRSDYLQRLGWLQVCLMGDYPRERLPELVRRLAAARPG